MGEFTFKSKKYSAAPTTYQSFLAKYDAAGRPVWIWVPPVSVTFSAFTSIATDRLNNIYIGYHESQLVHSNKFGYNLKLLKFDRQGNLLSDRILAESTYPISCTSIKFDSQLQPVLLGSYYSKVIIGSQEHLSPDKFNLFLIKSTANGDVLWTVDIGRNEHVINGMSEVALDKSNNIYVAGGFSESPEKVTILKKFDQVGNLVWEQTIERKVVPFLGILTGTSLKITNSQDIVLAGVFSGNISLGPAHFTNESPSFTNLFITEITNNGKVTGTVRSDVRGAVTPMSILINDKGEFYVSGTFVTDKFVFHDLTSEKAGNHYDIFLLKGSLKHLKPISPIDPVGPKDITIPNIITPNGDGKNDAFVVVALDLDAENSIMIYNRWGKLVYQSKAYQNNWTATNLTSGTYFYILQHKRTNKQYKGSVEVIK